ncbi:hypothetical protein HpBT101_03440 [Helicobacter pylori]
MLITRSFFLLKKNLFRCGLRHYGFFDYNHAFIKSNFFNSASDVWTYGVGMDALYNFINDKNTNFLGKNNKLSVGLFGVKHPTQKSLALMEKIISIHTNPNDIVLDPFMGSGTTGLACKNLQRRFIGIESEKEYFQIAKERLNLF